MDSPSIQPPLVERPEVFPGEPPPPGDYPTDHVITIGPNLDEEGMDLPNLQPHRFTAEQKACLYRAVQNNKQQVQKALDEFSDTCYANLPKKKADWDKMCARLVFLSACAGGACALVTGGVTTPVMARLAGSSTLLITLCTQLSPDSD
jgi:hypothetical protein